MKWLNLRNILLTLLILFLGFVIMSIKPYAEVEIKKLIAKEVLKYDDIKNFDLSNVRIGLLPPNVEFDKVDFLIKGSPEIKNIYVEKIKIYPEILRLLSFDLKIKNIYVRGLNLNIEDQKKKNQDIKIKFNYGNLEAIPVKNISIEDSKIKYNSIYFDIGFFDLRRKWNHYELFSDLNKIRINSDVPEIKVDRLALDIRKEKTNLKKISLSSGDSYLQLGFEINKAFDEKLLDLDFINSTEVRLTSRLNLENFKSLIAKYLKIKVTKLSGLAQILLYKSASTNKEELEYTLEAENLVYNNYFAENVSTNGKLNKNQLIANLFKLKNKNLVLSTKKLRLNKSKKTISVNTTGDISTFEVGGFLTENIGQGEIPVHVPGQTSFDCEGLITPNLNLSCNLAGVLQSLHIWSDSKKKDQTTIVKLPNSKFTAKANVFDKYMTFESFNELKNSQVAFEGTVDYITGFKVNYTSDFFNFSDIISLANIPLEGFGNIKGTTQGSSRWGEFSLRSDISNLSFFEYNLGQVVGDISYKKQNLYFKNLRSVIGESIINAEAEFDIKRAYLKTNAESKKISVQDLLFAIKEIAVPPIYISGDGSLNVTAEGPLNLGQMTYDIEGKFLEGVIFKDRYKNLEINIKAVEGEVVTQNQLVYFGDTINIEGEVNPKGMVDIIAIGDTLNLSRIKAIKDLGVEMTGLGQVQVQFKNFILLPDVQGQFKSANIVDDYNKLGSSEFEFVIHKDYSEINGALFDNSMVGEMHIPHHTEAPFFMNMELFKFDPFKFMSIFDSKISKVGSNTEISGNVNLQAPSFEIKKINGDMLLTEVLLKAERSSLFLKSPAELKVKNGVLSGKISFQDQNANQLTLRLSETKNSALGKISLGFLRTLIPSVDEIQGEMDINAEFKVLPQFSFTGGQGQINNLSLKVENLNHSFKDLNAKLDFNKRDIYLSNVAGLFANGPITGEGRIYFADGIGVELKGRGERLNLNIPEGFRSVVSGDYQFTGLGFPYLLSGDFIVNEGLFESEFSETSSEQFVLQPSQYLPKSKLSVSPLNLDLDIKTNIPIAINNSLVEGSATADLNIKGQPSYPIFTGQIRLTNDSKVIFQSNKFNVNSGLIGFNSVSPENAILNIDANARIKDFVDILEREYDIRMLVQGTGQNPQITFSSQPNLSEPQILSFLAFGMLENNSLNQEISLGDQGAQTGYQIGGIFLKNKFAKDIQDRLGVQFNFTSSYENQDVSPKVVVEKKFNSKFSLSGSRTLGTFQKNTVRGEYKINKKLSIIGLYENWDLDNQATLNRARLIDGDNVLGMDLQYNLEFE